MLRKARGEQLRGAFSLLITWSLPVAQPYELIKSRACMVILMLDHDSFVQPVTSFPATRIIQSLRIIIDASIWCSIDYL